MRLGQERRTYAEPIPIEGFSDDELALLARLARRAVFQICQTAGHGHIGGSSSSAELMTMLYFGGFLKLNPSDPADPRRDRVLVRGHLGPLRYRLFAWLEWLDENELKSYRQLGSRLHGHEDHLVTPGVDVSPSGSLGMLLSYGVGCALAARDMEQTFRTWVFLGDGEEQEGMVSEAARQAAHLRLNDLIVIIDRNGKQLSNPTAECDSSDLGMVWQGYGWNVEKLVDGHEIPAIRRAFSWAVEHTRTSDKPTVIIADTTKGFGLRGAEHHYSGYHTISRAPATVVADGIARISASISEEECAKVCAKLSGFIGIPSPCSRGQEWRRLPLVTEVAASTPNNPDAAQRDYFQTLRKSAEGLEIKRDGAYFLTADVTTREAVNELGARDLFLFHNVGVREQHLVGMAHGLSMCRPSARVVINSLDAFTYRCIDQINAALQGRSHLVIIGDVSGLTNSRNGRTHQTTGLPAALLAMDQLTFLEPWDAIDMFRCLDWAIGQSRGVVYIRVHSSNVRPAGNPLARRSISYYDVNCPSRDPDITLVSSGLTVDSCLEASSLLEDRGYIARVINIIDPKSLDKGFVDLIADGKPLLMVYNGDRCVLNWTVSSALISTARRVGRVASLGYSDGATGTFADLLTHFDLDGAGVLRSALALL